MPEVTNTKHTHTRKAGSEVLQQAWKLDSSCVFLSPAGDPTAALWSGADRKETQLCYSVCLSYGSRTAEVYETTVGSLLIIGRFLHRWSVVGVCGPFRYWVNQQVCYGSGGKLNKQAEDCTGGYGLNQRFLQGKREHSSGHSNAVTSWAFHEIQPYGCIIIWKAEETWGSVATASDSS